MPFAAVKGVLLARLFGLAGAFEQPPAADGTFAGHLHHQGHGKIAVGPAGAGQKPAEPPGFDDQISSALGADLLGDLVGHLDAFTVQVLLRLLQLGVKILVELSEKGLPVGRTLLHLVQPLLHLGGEVVVHNVVEFVLHQAGDHFSQGGGPQGPAPLLHHILPVHDGGDGGSVGGGTADALLLQGPDETGFGVSGGGLGEVLAGGQLSVGEGLPLLQIGERGGLFLLLVVLPLLVDGGEAGELQGGVAGTEDIAGVGHVDGQAVVDGVGHLTCQESGPDQLVQLELLCREILFDVLGHQRHIRGPDGFVGVLGAALGLEFSGLGGTVGPAVPLADKAPGGGHCFVGQAQRVGTHVGDQAHSSLAGDVDALVELLGHRHGSCGGHVQLAGGLLLEGGCSEGRSGLAVFLLPLHLGDGPGPPGHRVDDRLSLCFTVQLHLFVFSMELGLKRPQVGGHPLQVSLNGPVLLGLEGANLHLPLHHQPGGYRLHPSGGQAPADLLPQQRGELVAHDAVQNAPGLLGVHQVLVDGTGGGDGPLHHILGDLVKGHPVGLVVGDIEQLLQVPGDGFSLPVRVGGQIDLARALGRLLQVADYVLLALDGLVVGDKAALDIHAQLALGQVPDMAHRRLYLIPRAKVFADGLCLGRGLYDH